MRIAKIGLLMWALLTVMVPPMMSAQERGARRSSDVVVDDDGTVHVPAMEVPLSSFRSPEAKAYVTQHLKDMQNPEAVAQVDGVPRFMRGARRASATASGSTASSTTRTRRNRGTATTSL
jgi:hypothetical protein